MQLACPGCGRSGDDLRCVFCGVAREVRGYRVERVLAQGPHGRVYRAHAQDGSVVALKELQFASVPGAQQLDAFEREAATLKTLNHPRIPRYIENFSEGEGVQVRLLYDAMGTHRQSRRLFKPNTCKNFLVVPYRTGRPKESCRPAMRMSPFSISKRRISPH